MARKQQLSNKNKGKNTAKVTIQASLPQTTAGSRKHDFWTATLTVLSLVIVLSMLGYVLVAHNFAQAVFMVYPGIPLYAEFMRSEWFSIAGHLLLFGIIFAIACTKGVPEFTIQPYSIKYLQNT